MKALNFYDIQKLEKEKTYHNTIFLLDGLRTPGNIAGIIRLGDALGIQKILLRNSPLPDERSLMTTARSAHAYIDIELIESPQDIVNMKPTYEVLGLEWTDESESIFGFKAKKNTIIVIGNERHGISEELLKVLDRSVHIPMLGANSSMNVQQATSILSYEILRQEFHGKR